MSDFEFMVRREGSLARVDLNRPQEGNAMTRGMMVQLAATLRELGADASVHVTPWEIRTKLMGAVLGSYEAIAAVPVPVVALVHADALGYGAAVAVACDITLASASAGFAFPEIEHDIPPTMAMCAALGKVNAKALSYLIYSAEKLTAERAVAVGLASRVLPAASFAGQAAAPRLGDHQALPGEGGQPDAGDGLRVRGLAARAGALKEGGAVFTRKDGFDLARFEEVPWTHRVRFDGMKSRARIFSDGSDYGVRMTVVDFPFNSVEPRHVHPGTHATTVLKNRALVDGRTLKPLDVILGPGNEPHGPLEYPEGCNLLSCFQGSNDHSAVKELSTEKNYRLVFADEVPWRAGSVDGIETKTLIDHGAGTMLLEAWRCAPGATLPAATRDSLQALFVIDGAVAAAGEELGTWDMLRLPPASRHGEARFPRGATLLVITMR